MNILLVDDDQASRISIAEFLRELGSEVVECVNGNDALEQFIKSSFSLVLTDIRMPGLNGIELLKAINSLPAGRETRVVVFTGFGEAGTEEEAGRAGAYAYLTKPIDVLDLVEIVTSIRTGKPAE